MVLSVLVILFIEAVDQKSYLEEWGAWQNS